MYCELCVFFFSSRRRHTRYWRDWSSDVCSSDLALDEGDALRVDRHLGVGRGGIERGGEGLDALCDGLGVEHEARLDGDARSEERRVGKECRSRWAPYH